MTSGIIVEKISKHNLETGQFRGREACIIYAWKTFLFMLLESKVPLSNDQVIGMGQ